MIVNCEICTKEVKIAPSRLKNKHHTCSKQCMGILSSTLYSKKVQVKCSFCDNRIFYKKSHIKDILYPTCSRKCSAKIRSVVYTKTNNPRSLKLSDIERFFWEKAKDCNRRAMAKGIKSDITYLELVDQYNKQKGTCFYTSIPLNLEKQKRVKFNSLSVDRLDSKLGYTKDNIVLCINCVNMLKSDHSLEDIRLVFKSIVERGKENAEFF